jgi:hypothetical protein
MRQLSTNRLTVLLLLRIAEDVDLVVQVRGDLAAILPPMDQVGRPLCSALAAATERRRSNRADGRRPAWQSTGCSPEETDQPHDTIAIGPGVTRVAY